MINRRSGDTILQTLTRVLSATFIEKYEYDMKTRDMVTRDILNPIENSFHRIDSTVDSHDIKINRFEEIIIELQK